MLIVGLVGYGVLQMRYAPPAQPKSLKLSVELPVPMQLALWFGDRYLAANADFFWAEMAATESLDPVEAVVYGRLLRDATDLNPYHEDSYYLTAATIPWKQGSDLNLAQEVLQQAANARQWDWMPYFFFGFNQFYFQKDYTAAAASMYRAAERAGDNSEPLTVLAGRLYSRAAPTDVAANALEMMAASSHYPPLKQYLIARAEQVRRGLALQSEVDAYIARIGRKPRSLDELAAAGIEIPVDPFGGGYRLDESGIVRVVEKK